MERTNGKLAINHRKIGLAVIFEWNRFTDS